MCQINNYKNALPAGQLIPIVSNYPNETVTLDLLGPYPMSRVRRTRYVLVITDHFIKWAEIIPLKKASARVIADKFFDNYVSRFEAPIKLISDSGPQFCSDIFENLSERLGIRHLKTVVYRPQANRTERVNRDLVQMIANYVNEQHDTWSQFLREFAYVIRTAVNETTGKTTAELFLVRKLIMPFQKLVMVSDGTEFAVGNIERLFEEARRNTEPKHGNWKKYYNRRWRDVQIKVNDWVLVATHPLNSATRKVVARFKPKFEGPYRVLDIKNNNVVIWKDETQGMCCSEGKVQLFTLEPYPEPLHSLLTHQDPLSEHFLSTIRKYNGCFQMKSFRAKEIKEGNFMPTFKVQGPVYHRIGSL
ncbi:retrovirus-related Pol polyprotein from transposon 17.6 [Trichonephila clavipes]|nr:retrovirus-related Pol polyprotein from transposon 17.6 [Trichonephila clavipes]